MSNRKEVITDLMKLLAPAVEEVDALNEALLKGKWNKAASRRLRTAINNIGKAKADLRRRLRQADQEG